MDLPHRHRNNEEARDVWIRAFPVKNLVHIMLNSLGNSESLPDLQVISTGKFILSILNELQELNQVHQPNQDPNHSSKN